MAKSFDSHGFPDQGERAAMTPEEFRAELAATQTIGEVLAALTPEARDRVMRWAAIYFIGGPRY